MKKILLVDDDDQIRSLLSIILKRAGYELTEARDGVEALRSCNQQAIDVVLTDLIMPDKEGLETIIELRRTHPAIRIIAMSGGGRGDKSAYLASAKSLGAHAVIPKPFSKAEVLRAVADVLS